MRSYAKFILRQANRFVLSIMILWAIGVDIIHAQTFTPICHITPTSATPPPTPAQVYLAGPSSDLGKTRFFETMWESIGSRFALKPRTVPAAVPTFAPEANSYRLSPAIDTSQVGGNNPNDYSAHVVQSVFQDDMWRTFPEDRRVDDFAWPVILMFASEHMAVAELTSGVGKTRSGDKYSDPEQETLRDPDKESKTAIGHLSQGILARGGSKHDLFSAIGSDFAGSGGRYNGDSC